MKKKLSNYTFNAGGDHDQPVEWAVTKGLIPYPVAVAAMEKRVAAIRAGKAPELVWLLEHPSLYSAGTSAKEDDLLDARRFPVFKSGRGGQYTYHGPGQRVAYVMLDLTRRGRDVRAFVQGLEQWVIQTLSILGVEGAVRDGRIGVWVTHEKGGKSREDKIAAIGIRLRRWVSFHGISLNVSPNLSHFEGIVPCGITEHGVTSLTDLGLIYAMADVDQALRQAFEQTFSKIKPADFVPDGQ